MALNKFFRFPFAVTGDKSAVPDDTQLSGDVSFEQGYGPDYARDPATDPLAKNIERDKMNQLLFDITTALREYQITGFPDFITSAQNGGTAYSYDQNAIVKYSGVLYISLVSSNTALPNDATKWALLPTPALLQQSAYTSAIAGGTADAITASFSPPITALPTAGTLALMVRANSANATNSPTFAPDGLTAKTIVKGNNLALAAGDIAGAGHWLDLQYDATLDKWVLQNPAKGISTIAPTQIQSVSASVAANALTVGLAATSLDFRNATLTNGTPNAAVSVGALSLVVPSGATLGTVNAVAARLALLVAYNAGTPVLCIANLAGGVNLDETTLISPTTISAGATSADVIYSASAVGAGSPFRVVGFVDISEATAGTWATAPTTVQGIGGQALAAMSSIGYGQTWQNVVGSRAFATTYYNTTGKPIFVIVGYLSTSGTATLTATINGIGTPIQTSAPTASAQSAGGILVPPGASYAVSVSPGTPTLSSWAELR